MQQQEQNSAQLEEEGDDAIDLAALRKEKKNVEDKLDMENARVISEIATEYFNIQEPNEEEIEKMLNNNPNPTIISNDSNTITIVTDNSAVKVNASLFDDDENLPDDIDDENIPDEDDGKKLEVKN